MSDGSGNLHKFQSHAAVLKSIHVPVLPSAEDLDAIPDASSSFFEALTEWRQMNLTSSFTAFADAVEPLCKSMHMLLHNWQSILDLWTSSVVKAEVDALEPMFDLSGKLVYDLRQTLLPVYEVILSQLPDMANTSMPPAGLQALLSALSTLFKYLLVPHTELLDVTWIKVAAVFRAGGEGARLLAECWGRTIRRVKSEARDKLLVSMLEENEVDIAVAVALAEAMKSPNHGHPPSAPSILRFLLQHLGSHPTPSSRTVIKRVVTSLLHHTTPAHFSPLMEAILDAQADFGSENMNVYLDVLRIPFSVRQGARVQESHMKRIMPELSKLPPSAELVYVCVAVLTASNLAIWASEGKRFLDAIWDRDMAFAMQIAQALCETEWKGFSAFVLPYLIQHRQALFVSHERSLLRLLNEINHKRTLQEVANVAGGRAFLDALAKWLSSRWQDLSELDEDAICDLSNALPLLTQLPSRPDLLPLVQRFKESASQEQWETTPANSVWGLATCLSSLAESGLADEVASMVPFLAEEFSWNVEIMTSTADIVSVLSKALTPQLEKAKLEPLLLSHHAKLRLAALRILCSPSTTATEEEKAAYQRCLTAEEVSLSVQNIRERILKTERVTGSAAVDWLMAQLTINLRPLWLPTTQTLAKAVQSDPDAGFARINHELERLILSADQYTGPEPGWSPSIKPAKESEVEKAFRDPGMERMESIVGDVVKEGMDRELDGLIAAQRSPERLDLQNYETQLLKTLQLVPGLAEKHNRSLVTLLLKLVGIEDVDASISSTTPISRRLHSRLSHWLELFSRFSNPRALYKASTLHQLYLACLCTPERQLQRLAVDCMLSDSASPLKEVESVLRGLMDETRFRDELSSLALADIGAQSRADVLPVIIRFLYGIMTTRSTKSGARRRAILLTLTSCTGEELAILVQLMLDPFDPSVKEGGETSFEVSTVRVTASARQQVGFLRLLGEVLIYLAPALEEHWPILFRTTLEIIVQAQQSIVAATKEVEPSPAENGEDLEQESDKSVLDTESQRPLYAVRQLGFKRLTDFVRRCSDFDFAPYMQTAFDSFISPRLAVFSAENSQAPSSLLELFVTWSERASTLTFLVQYDARLLPSIVALLANPSVKPPVVSRVLDLLENAVKAADSDATVVSGLLAPNAEYILRTLSEALSQHGSRPIDNTARRQIELLAHLAPHLSDKAHASKLITSLKPLFRRTGKGVSERVLSDVLSLYASLFPLVDELRDPGSVHFGETYALLCSLFNILKERQARLSLVAAFNSLLSGLDAYKLVTDLVTALNAYSERRPEEPDFDKRLSAFAAINESHYSDLDEKQWEPILVNALFFLQDTEELSLRTNSAFTIRRFITVVSSNSAPELQRLFSRIVYSGLRKVLKSKAELVRAEALALIGSATENCDFSTPLKEMKCLLASGDPEANVFNNLYHIQVHRRTRALRRVAEQARNDELGANVLSEIFVPLLGHLIGQSGSIDHQIVNEAVTALGQIARKLSWRSYYSLVQRYLRLCRRKTHLEKLFVRVVLSILENFAFSLSDTIATEELEPGEDEDEDDEDAEAAAEEDIPAAKAAQISAALDGQKIIDAMTGRLLPVLLSYLDDKQSTEDHIRIPLAYGIVCVALNLPDEPQKAQVRRMLTILCQIFRSRTHDTRLLAKETLCKIALTLGLSYMPLIITELRAALFRGPQLHVLAVVLHAVLAHVTQPDAITRFSNMDDCASDIAHVAAEVIFGQSGKDTMSEEFKTTFREVRSSRARGLDTIQIVSRLVSVSHVRDLLTPIHHAMSTRDANKTSHLVDDALHRIASGLNTSLHLSPPDILSLCYTLIGQKSGFQQTRTATSSVSKQKSDFAVQLKRETAEEHARHSTPPLKFVGFGLDLFITAFRRGLFNLQDQDILDRLEPLVPLIGETLYSDDAQVAATGVKASAAIVRCPLRAVEKGLPVFIKRLLSLIRKTGSMDAELTQACLKSLAVILRESEKAQIGDSDLKYLLELIGPELEEPSRQATAFTLLRAIIARQFVAPEIYDLMGNVFDVLVTNQSTQVREVCRGVALQFLLDYPQGKSRLRKHMLFLATNLSYEFESGRTSVMELFSAVLEKFQPDLLREYADMLFTALVMNLANDDSTKCREMCAELIKKLSSRLDWKQQKTVLSRVHLWINQLDTPELPPVAAQVYGLLIDQLKQGIEPSAGIIVDDLSKAIATSATSFAMQEQSDDDAMAIDIDWRLPYHAMTATLKLCRVLPSLAQSPKLPFRDIVSFLLFPHAWVRLCAARMVGLILSTAPLPSDKAMPDHPQLDSHTFFEVARLSTVQLRSPNLDSDTSLQIVKNLLFIGKSFARMSISVSAEIPEEADEQEADEEEEDVSDKKIQENPLAWLFSRLSYQLRRAHTDRRHRPSGPVHEATSASLNWSQQPLAILRWFAAMASFLPPETAETFLIHIISPVYRILDDTSSRGPDMDEVKALCQELLDLLRERVGTTAFTTVYNTIRQRVQAVRAERRTARVMEMTTDPEKAAKDRMRRNAVKGERRKRKSSAFADAKGRLGKKRRFE